LCHQAGGDTTEGQGGVPAFVGFNAGNGTKAYEYKPFSQTTFIRHAQSAQAIRGSGSQVKPGLDILCLALNISLFFIRL
jgi:hypothetical protein